MRSKKELDKNLKIVKPLQFIITIAILLFFYSRTNAQELTSEPVHKKEITQLVHMIADSLETYYVSLEIGKEISNLILKKNKEGAYKDLANPNELANQLTSDLRSINGDLHLSVKYSLINDTPKSKHPSKKVDTFGEWSNYGFQEIKVLDGNVGYLKITHFTNWGHFENAKKTITSSINALQNTEALIIDVRNNGGGFESIVAYLISYFFDGKSIHLSDYYYRYTDERYGIHTTTDISGKKLPDIPLYVLVNNQTTSAAESLAYMLKHLGRATIIGETTAGAGNGAMTHRVSDKFTVTIASETTINTITKTSFEKIGVIPNIKTTSKEAFSKGYLLALEYLKNKNAKNIHPSNYENIIEFSALRNNKIIIDKTIFKKYIGTYKGTGIEIIISINKNELYAQLIGKNGTLKLIPRENHIFIVDGLKERIQFILNENNQVIKLIGIETPMELEKVINKK